jgi:hypothetical protein
MSVLSVLEVLGFFLMGTVFGALGFRELLRLVQRGLCAPGPCGQCGVEAHLVSCDRCERKVGMCHSYVVMGTDEPSIVTLHPRRKSHLCVSCLVPYEKDILEEMLHP